MAGLVRLCLTVLMMKAFYGLGQHQSEELNMKDKNEELFQYNTKVSIPFVVSNKNFGILWDSYSFCRWGNPNDYQQLNHSSMTKMGNRVLLQVHIQLRTANNWCVLRIHSISNMLLPSQSAKVSS